MQSELSYDVLVGQEFPYLFIYFNIQYLITWGVTREEPHPKFK